LGAFRRKIRPLPPANLGGSDLREFTPPRLGGDAVDFACGWFSALRTTKGSDSVFDLGAPFRGDRAILGTHADDFKTLDDVAFVACGGNVVAGGKDAAGEFVLINFPSVTDGSDHFSLGERKPLFGFGVEGRIGGDQVRVQLRVEWAYLEKMDTDLGSFAIV
jgi:hypothetical protein